MIIVLRDKANVDSAMAIIRVLFISFAIIVCVSGFPRDTVRENVEEIRGNENIAPSKEESAIENKGLNLDVYSHPHRVSCRFEEVTEDQVCQEHCLPKGYSYGLCTNYVCSCI